MRPVEFEIFDLFAHKGDAAEQPRVAKEGTRASRRASAAARPRVAEEAMLAVFASHRDLPRTPEPE